MNKSKIVSLNLYISFNVGVCMFLNISVVQWLSFFYLMGAPRSDGARISPIKKDKSMKISLFLCAQYALANK